MSEKLDERVILIVDDEPELVEILNELLAPICDKVLVANNGRDALEIIKNNGKICAIISDIKMPVMTGLQLLAEVRMLFNPVPFVVMTGFADSESYRQAVKLNATDFVEKPFKGDELVEIMKKAVLYGQELKKIELELDVVYKDSASSSERVQELRKAKRTVLMMRIENSIYVTKKIS